MKKCFMAMCTCLLLVGKFVGTSDADIQLFIDAGSSSNDQLWSFGDYTVGSEFTVSNAIDINALGYIDAEGDGLSVSHQVGLWRVADQSLLASVIVTPGSQTTPNRVLKKSLIC